MMSRNSNPGKRTKTVFSMAILLLFFGSWVQAAQISVKTDHSPVAVDETFQLIFTVDGEPDGTPDFSPLEKDFEVLGTSQSRNISIVNGKASRTTRYLVNVLPRRSGELTVPSVNFGKDVSPVLKLRVQDATTGKTPAAASGDAVFMEVSVDENEPWVQQQVILTVRIYSRIQWKEASLSDPQFRGGEVLVQKLGDDRRYQKQRDGQSWQVIERRYALFPQKSGELSMDPLSLNLRIPAGRKQQRSPFGSFNDPFFDDFFSSRSYRNKVVRSKSLSLKVRPIPADFHGKRWLVARDVRLEESWSDAPEDLKTGEPVTRTLAIVADGVTLGQLPELTLPRIQGLRIYPDDPVNKEQATDKGILSTSSRKFAIIPTHPGEYQLPAVELKWWNSAVGKEQTVRLEPRKLKVTGAVQNMPLPAPASPVANPLAPSPQQVQQTSESNRPALTVASPVAGNGVNTWLIAGNVVLAVLWLFTLVLYLRARKAVVPAVLPEEHGKNVPDMGRAWRQLHQAIQSGDAAEVRSALLELAPGLWPEQTPRSLEAMAERVDAPLSDALLNLSRHLYADSRVSWDAEVIESGMKTIRPHGDQGKYQPDKPVLKPLYPDSGYQG
ncbi:BatD family protein [Thiolapillus sp.]